MDTAAHTDAPLRRGGPAWLADALVASRADTLATFAIYEAGLADRQLTVPQRAELNPPLWELGHIGWFQEFWLARNPERGRGAAADPDAPRPVGVRANADALYNSSRVPHDSRWSLPLPDAATTRAELAAQLETTLELLQRCEDSDDALYFHRLALAHEDMHHEAALYMAQGLGLAVDDPRWQPVPLTGPRSELSFGPAHFALGSAGAGFAFDNELAAHDVALDDYAIDSRVVRWEEVLHFVEAGGYREPRWWSDGGRRWLAATGAVAPRFLRHEGGAWLCRRWGRWQPLNPSEPACHLSAYEAEAWCRWAGRRLPTEAEWEHAAVAADAGEAGGAYRWGDVWEWTSSVFAPYPGFTRHPYRDYSAPWFGDRPVLRGASFATQPRMRSPRYRNYFLAGRTDLFAGFRSCAA